MCKWLLIPLLILTALSSQPTSATSYAREFLEFKSICSVVEFESAPQLDDLLDRSSIDRSVADTMGRRLRESGLSYPIEFGRQCYPGKVGSAARQLSIQFHVTLARIPDTGSAVVAALIAHVHYDNISRPPHNLATVIRLCSGAGSLSNCIIANLNQYFDDNILPAIERSQAVTKERRK